MFVDAMENPQGFVYPALNEPGVFILFILSIDVNKR
jgi:hypothetical protein